MTLPLSKRNMRRVGVWLSWLGTDNCLSYSTEQTGREPFLLYLLFLSLALCSGYWLTRHSVGGRTNDSAVTVWLCDYEFPHTISYTLPSPLSLSFCLSKSHLRCHASMSDEHGPVSVCVPQTNLSELWVTSADAAFLTLFSHRTFKWHSHHVSFT